MGFHRPYRFRHLKPDPGVHTHPFVGWVLIALTSFVAGVVLFCVGAVVWITIRF